MAGKWRATVLGKLIETGDAHLQTGPFGTALKAAEYASAGVPLISVGEIRHGYFEVGADTPRVTKETTQRLPKFVLELGDIVFGRKGGIDRNAIVQEEQRGWFLGSDGIRLRLSERYSSLFFSYLMRAQQTRDWLTQNSEGTTMPSLNQEILGRIPIVVPPLPEQKAIAHILGTLDDKIELNRRMNATLEAMARALFQSWFVDFDPVRAKLEGRHPPGLDKPTADLFPAKFQDSPLGPIPAGWHIGNVGDLCVLNRDTVSPGEFPAEIFDHFSLPAYDDGRRAKEELGEAIMSNKFLVTPNSVLLSKLNPHIPRIWLPDLHPARRSVCSTEFMVVCAKPGVSREYLFSLFTSTSFASVYGTLVTGTTGSHQRIRPETVLEMQVIIPPSQLIHSYTAIAKQMFNQINRNIEQSRTLAALRDTLLPKLLSGELSVTPKLEEKKNFKRCDF